jgi:predicted metalloprotease with PDZ domain
MFLHLKDKLNIPVEIEVLPRPQWQTVATGMEQLQKPGYHFRADGFDLLYDSPILMGELETFPSFNVGGKEHRFITYKAGNFDRNAFMSDMKKMVETASGIIGDIPYPHYTFLAIGPGGGGIEHLNSASIAFEGSKLHERSTKIRLYNFLAHEYFHHYNVKRIRPIELGPFDYENGSRTKMLWLSEGVTVYYEYLILRRAGFTSDEELLETLSQSISEYENKPGRQFQTPAEASFSTWEDGPFGRTGDKINKTISPYDKGPMLGLMLDFIIRHETKNQRSMDDLMRRLYFHYYKKLDRGFTESEFRTEAENMAGRKLDDFFDQIYTLKPADYSRFLGYAGLQLEKKDGPKGTIFEIKKQKSFTELQQEILKSWLSGK